MPAFQFANNKVLRKLGLEGDLCWAMVHEGALQLQDDAQHVVRITPSQVDRIRIGYVDAKRRSYHTRVWRDGEQRPLELIPLTSSWTGYRETVYEFVQLLRSVNRLDRVETGSSKWDALLGPILMGIPAIGAIVIALFVLTNEPWWGRMLVPLIPVIALSLLIWMGVKRYWPRTINDVEDLKVQLPPG